MILLLKAKLGVFDQLKFDWSLVSFMAVMAAAGSFVSVLSRLSTFVTTRGYDAFLVFCTGFFKPWIGVTFGIFIFFVLDSHLINIAALTGTTATATNTATQSIYVVLGFISGFSERLVSDFIGKAETRILGATPDSKMLENPQAKTIP